MQGQVCLCHMFERYIANEQLILLLILLHFSDGNVMIWDTRCNQSSNKPVDAIFGAHKMELGAKSGTTPTKTLEARGTNHGVSSLSYHPQQPNLLTTAGAADGYIKTFDLRFNHAGLAAAHRGRIPVSKIKWPRHWKRSHGWTSISIDGPLVYASCMDNRIYAFTENSLELWDVYSSKGLCIDTFHVHASARNGRIVCGSSGGNVYCWDANKHVVLRVSALAYL